jgi:hypothetical protein
MNSETANQTANAQESWLERHVSRPAACKGTNCGCKDGVSHSKECREEHDADTAMPYDEKWLHEPDDGRGWKCQFCKYGGSENRSVDRFCANCHTHR